MDNIRNIINEGRPKESDGHFYEPYWYRVGVHDGYDYAFKELEENRLKHAQTLSDAESKREMEYVSQFMNKHHRIPTYSDVIEETRKKLIERACTFIRETTHAAGMGSMDSRIKYFRKVMEE